MSGELQHFHSDSVPPISNKTLMQSLLFQMANRIMCHEREMLLKLNLFQLMKRHHSWNSVLISIYRIDARDFKNRNVHARER